MKADLALSVVKYLMFLECNLGNEWILVVMEMTSFLRPGRGRIYIRSCVASQCKFQT